MAYYDDRREGYQAHGMYHEPSQRPYDGGSHYSQHGRPQQSYSSPPPGPAVAPPEYSPPRDKPAIPRNWIPQWDRRHQRWFYYDRDSGRSQWEAPGYIPPRPSYAPEPSQGSLGPGGGRYPEERRSRGGGGSAMGIAGGVAVGAIGGALLANALHDSDSEDEPRHSSRDGGAYISPESPPRAPVVNAYGDEVDESDRESVEEARERYLEELDEARSSSADSSDREDLEKARDRYEREYEEAYYSDD